MTPRGKLLPDRIERDLARLKLGNAEGVRGKGAWTEQFGTEGVDWVLICLNLVQWKLDTEPQQVGLGGEYW